MNYLNTTKKNQTDNNNDLDDNLDQFLDDETMDSLHDQQSSSSDSKNNLFDFNTLYKRSLLK